VIEEPRPRGPQDAAALQKIEARERAAHEQHLWVRLTRCCNNRCAFCLDTDSQDNTHVPVDRVREEIRAGRSQGATRLILSGGEPTIHPHYVEFLALGRKLGFQKIQTITNGRRFAYPRFLRACLDAGLSEITFSIHGHDAELHDRLVGVPGAFEQAVAGLRAALADGRPVVNVDVCLNRQNIRDLPKILDRFIGLGVHEFDLLHLIPFGRSFEQLQELAYDIDEAWPAVEHALELSQRPDLYIWFNRFPPVYLEGHEHLIQDPQKLHDEVRGRRADFDRWLREGTPLRCRQPDRCRYCYLNEFCATLEEMLGLLEAGGHRVYRVDPRDSVKRPPPPASCDTAWVRAADLGAAARAVRDLPGSRVILELDRYSASAEGLPGDVLEGRSVARVLVDDPASLQRLLDGPGSYEVVALLTPEIADHVAAHCRPASPRLVLAAANHERLTRALERDADLPSFFQSYSETVPVENVPACISGRAPGPQSSVLDAGILAPSGGIDIVGFTGWYIREAYRLKSRRCRACSHVRDCDGAHVNFIRAHGFGVLQPERASTLAPG
jgi:pyruvate-formate lyase-activating enzyme